MSGGPGQLRRAVAMVSMTMGDHDRCDIRLPGVFPQIEKRIHVFIDVEPAIEKRRSLFADDQVHVVQFVADYGRMNVQGEFQPTPSIKHERPAAQLRPLS